MYHYTYKTILAKRSFSFVWYCNRKVLYGVISVVFLFTGIKPTSAWVYPEHRNIALLAIQNLSPAFRSELNILWKEMRTGYETRLTESVMDSSHRIKTTMLDYAAWPAIAGDHSCSPDNLLHNVLQTDWILQVANIAAALDNNLAKAKTKSQHLNALQLSDMQLIKADEEYATRAGANSVHFLLPRTNVAIPYLDYFIQTTTSGSGLNALGAYVLYHTHAIRKMIQYTQSQLSDTEKQNLLRAAFADEAFAIHFIEDAFAAGHAAGSRGNASLQKGTHDYYNEAGLEVQTWDGKRLVVMGDSYMRKEDAVLVAGIVKESLENLLTAAMGKNAGISTPSNRTDIQKEAGSYNACTNTVMPDEHLDPLAFKDILIQTLIPGLTDGKGELPRFRAEIGTFIGISASLNGSAISGGFGKSQMTKGGVGGMEANIRFGLGLDGVLNQSGDGLIFIQAGWKQEASSTNNFTYTNTAAATNSLESAIPARAAYNLRIRLPFCLIPGDLILASPLLLFAPKTYNKMAIAAVNGGLIPWQSGFATGIGRLQFILGREIGLSFYGLRSPKDFIILPTTGNNSAVVEYRSTKIDFPILEFRPLRTFSQNQTSSLMLQINTGIDIPSHASTLIPVGDPTPDLKSVWYVGMRLLFNWRHYF